MYGFLFQEGLGLGMSSTLTSNYTAQVTLDQTLIYTSLYLTITVENMVTMMKLVTPVLKDHYK